MTQVSTSGRPKKFFSSSEIFRLAVGSTQPPSACIPGTFLGGGGGGGDGGGGGGRGGGV